MIKQFILILSLIVMIGCAENLENSILTSTVAAPDNYQIEFENEYLRIIRVRYSPGESSAMHSHEPFVGVTLTGAEGSIFTYTDGSSETRSSSTPGSLIDGSLVPHSIVNGSIDQENIFVELKEPYPTEEPTIPNLVDAAPNLASVELEKPGIRVVRIKNIGKGDTPLHSHRAGVSVPLTDIDVEVTLPSGEVRRVYKLAGEVAWEEPRAHKGKNLSDEPNEMILFELM